MWVDSDARVYFHTDCALTANFVCVVLELIPNKLIVVLLSSYCDWISQVENCWTLSEPEPQSFFENGSRADSLTF